MTSWWIWFAESTSKCSKSEAVRKVSTPPLYYAACARPFQSAFGEDIYDTPYERSAAILHGIICDHVFVDGNKRTGTSIAILLLMSEGVVSTLDGGEDLKLALLGEVALATASGKLTVEQVTFWIRRIFAPAENT